jgi:hypothetical protein
MYDAIQIVPLGARFHPAPIPRLVPAPASSYRWITLLSSNEIPQARPFEVYEKPNAFNTLGALQLCVRPSHRLETDRVEGMKYGKQSAIVVLAFSIEGVARQVVLGNQFERTSADC